MKENFQLNKKDNLMVKNLCKNSDKKTRKMIKQIKYSTKMKN